MNVSVLGDMWINVPHHIEISQLICNANQLTAFSVDGSTLSVQVFTFKQFMTQLKLLPVKIETLRQLNPV